MFKTPIVLSQFLLHAAIEFQYQLIFALKLSPCQIARFSVQHTIITSTPIFALIHYHLQIASRFVFFNQRFPTLTARVDELLHLVISSVL